jgi:CRISPR type III-A/MTUBE-associated protein Csm6
MSVLFAPLGNTDPIMNYHDGPALHIIRHYPDITHVYFFLTKWISQKHRNYDFYRKAINDFIEKTGRKIEYEFIENELEEPQDFDKSYDIFLEELRGISEKHPNEKIYINISSGTPQMKMNLCLLVSNNIIPRMTAIQVTNPMKGTAAPSSTNSKDYDIETQIFFNEDNEPGKEKRCNEVKLLTLFKVKRINQIIELIEHYNYFAAVAMLKNITPDDSNIIKLLHHLKTRQESIDVEKSLRHIGKKTFNNIQLFPSKNQEAVKIIEYFLLLKNLQRNNYITDMYFRANNLLIELQKSFISNILKFNLDSISEKDKDIEKLSRDKLREKHPQLLDKLDINYGHFNEKSFFSIKNLNIIINHLIDDEKSGDNLNEDLKSIVSFFNAMDRFSINRNTIAHGLDVITEEKFRKDTCYSSSKFIEKLEFIIKVIYPKDATDNYLNIYDILNQEVKRMLGVD